MTAQEINKGLKSLGYPVAYSHFAEGNVPVPPYITYYFPGTDNFSADGVVYMPTRLRKTWRQRKRLQTG